MRNFVGGGKYFDVNFPQMRKSLSGAETPPVLNMAFNMDCLVGMNLIPDKSVDLILTDLPYGTTCNKWDVVIPLSELWAQYKRIIKDTGVICLFGDGMFTAKLMMSNPEMWRYNLVYVKKQGTDFFNAPFKPMKSHEDILVFYKKRGTYNPLFRYGKPYKRINLDLGKTSANWDVCKPGGIKESKDGK